MVFSQSLLHLRCRIVAIEGGLLKGKQQTIITQYQTDLSSIPNFSGNVTLMCQGKNEFFTMSLYFPETKDSASIAPVAHAGITDVNLSEVIRFTKTKFGKII